MPFQADDDGRQLDGFGPGPKNNGDLLHATRISDTGDTARSCGLRTVPTVHQLSRCKRDNGRRRGIAYSCPARTPQEPTPASGETAPPAAAYRTASALARISHNFS